jgi:hypothetical protein
MSKPTKSHPPAFKPGDLVMLASTSPYMTVFCVRPKDTEDLVDVVFWDGANFREETFAAKVLRRVYLADEK